MTMTNRFKWLYPYSMAALFGIMLTFSFAPLGIFPLAVLAFIGLMHLQNKTKHLKQAFWLGFCFGIGTFGSGVSWVYISIERFGEAPVPIAIALTSGLVAILSLFPACATYFTERFFKNSSDERKNTLAFPALWALLEWCRSLLFTGFPWLLVGYSQQNSPLKGLAPIFGVYGLSLAIVVTAALLLHTYYLLRAKQQRAAYKHIGIAILLWLLAGFCSLIPWTKPNHETTPLHLVQGNIPQSLKWSHDHLQLSLDRYRTLTMPGLKPNHIVIWPEAAVPLPLQSATTYINELDKAAREKNAHIILGIPIASNDPDTYYNGIITLGAQRQAYIKKRLVPFGEYLPLPELTSPIMRWLHIPMSTMQAGSYAQPPLRIGSLVLQPTICYEIAFPELVRTQNTEINAILTITNDAWFGDSFAKAQHLQMAAMRALEMGRPVIFVGNDGITGLIDPKGHLHAALKPNEADALTVNLVTYSGITPWMTNGMDPVLATILFFFYMAKRRTLSRVPTLQPQQSMTETDNPHARTI